MSETTREERIAEIARRVEAATEGPWAAQHLTGNHDGSIALGSGAFLVERSHAACDGGGCDGCEWRGMEDVEIDDHAPSLSGVFDDQNGEVIDFDRVIVQFDSTTGTNANADAAFIAHAREDVPYLLAALSASERALEEAREALRRLADTDTFTGKFLATSLDHNDWRDELFMRCNFAHAALSAPTTTTTEEA